MTLLEQFVFTALVSYLSLVIFSLTALRLIGENEKYDMDYMMIVVCILVLTFRSYRNL